MKNIKILLHICWELKFPPNADYFLDVRFFLLVKFCWYSCCRFWLCEHVESCLVPGLLMLSFTIVLFFHVFLCQHRSVPQWHYPYPGKCIRCKKIAWERVIPFPFTYPGKGKVWLCAVQPAVSLSSLRTHSNAGNPCECKSCFIFIIITIEGSNRLIIF